MITPSAWPIVCGGRVKDARGSKKAKLLEEPLALRGVFIAAGGSLPVAADSLNFNINIDQRTSADLPLVVWFAVLFLLRAVVVIVQ